MNTKTHYPTYDLSFEDALRYDDSALLTDLLDKGLFPNAEAACGEPLLIAALRYPSIGLACTLLERGADASARAANGKSAFLEALSVFPQWKLEEFWPQPDVLTRTPQGETPLHLAVVAHDPQIVAWLLEQGADAAAADAEGETSLDLCRRLSAQSQDAEEKAWLRDCERILTRRPCVLDAAAYEALNPALSAAEISADSPGSALNKAVSKGNFELTEKLLQVGADPNVRAEPCSEPALVTACGMLPDDAARAAFIPLLLQYGADPSWPDVYGYTPLMDAADEGDAHAVSLLLEAGANPYVRNADDTNALYMAYRGENRDIFNRLSELGVDATAFDYLSGNSPLSSAIWNADVEMVARLLALGAHPFCNPVVEYTSDWVYAEEEASRTGIEDEEHLPPEQQVWRLLREKFPLAEPVGNRDVSTGLFLNAVSYGLDAEVSNALSRGVSPDARNLAGKSALRIACEREDEQMVYTLLRYGANPNVEPSSLAAVQGKRPAQDRIARLLLGFGAVPAEVGLSEEYKNEALLTAARQGRAAAVRCLLAAGVSPNGGGGKNLPLAAASTPRVVALLVEAGADPNAHDPNRSLADTPLTSKAHRGKTACVEALLAAGADIEERDKQGMTPLLLAVAGGHLPCVRALLAAGVDINRPDPFGNTPLMTAFSHRRLPVFRELLRAGADVTLRDCGGRSVADDVVSRQGWWSAWVEPYRALLAEL